MPHTFGLGSAFHSLATKTRPDCETLSKRVDYETPIHNSNDCFYVIGSASLCGHTLLHYKWATHMLLDNGQHNGMPMNIDEERKIQERLTRLEEAIRKLNSFVMDLEIRLNELENK